MAKCAIIDDHDCHSDMLSLSDMTACPVITADQMSQYDYVLRYTDSQLKLHAVNKNLKPLTVDFVHGKLARRSNEPGRRTQLIAKAIGIKPGFYPRVLDATAGLASDAFVLSQLGCSVVCVERHPIIAALVQDALSRWCSAYPTQSVPFDYHCCAVQTHLKMSDHAFYDSIYLDPMYPARTKSALVKKEMRMVHDLVGYDGASSALIDLVMPYAAKRVVVKRPLHAACLDEKKPSWVYKGKSTRYDVYTVTSPR